MKNTEILKLAQLFNSPKMGSYSGAKYRYFVAVNRRKLKTQVEDIQTAITLPGELIKYMEAKDPSGKMQLDELRKLAATDELAKQVLAKDAENKSFLEIDAPLDLHRIDEADVPADMDANSFDAIFDFVNLKK